MSHRTFEFLSKFSFFIYSIHENEHKQSVLEPFTALDPAQSSFERTFMVGRTWSACARLRGRRGILVKGSINRNIRSILLLPFEASESLHTILSSSYKSYLISISNRSSYLLMSRVLIVAKKLSHALLNFNSLIFFFAALKVASTFILSPLIFIYSAFLIEP